MNYATGYPAVVSLVLLVVRLFLGPMIFAHGFQKYFRGGKIDGTAGWFHGIGVRPGRLNAYLAASTELGVGVLMTLGLLTPFASAGLISLMTVAVVTVHRNNGFFNFNKGQGVEYNVAVAVMALVPSAVGAGRYSLDYAWHILHWSLWTDLSVSVVLGLGGAAAQLLIFYRSPAAD